MHPLIDAGLLLHLSYCGQCALNTGVRIYLRDPALNDFVYIPKVILLGHVVIVFGTVLHSWHTVFHSGCTRPILHSHQQCTGCQLFHILTNACYVLSVCFLTSIHPNAWEVARRFLKSELHPSFL